MAVLKKLIPKMQKHIIKAAFILSALFFVYSLIFATDLYPLSQFSDSTSGFYVEGAELAGNTQLFNRILLYLGLILIVASLAMFIYFSGKRRLFYPGNYISCIAFSVIAIGIAAFVFFNVIVFRGMYLKIDFAKYAEKAQGVSARYVKSTFFFDLGIILSLLMIIDCVFIIMLVVYKFKLKSGEKKAKPDTAKNMNSDSMLTKDGGHNAVDKVHADEKITAGEDT